MSIRTLLDILSSKLSPAPTRRHRRMIRQRISAARRSLRLESLEERRLLAFVPAASYPTGPGPQPALVANVGALRGDPTDYDSTRILVRFRADAGADDLPIVPGTRVSRELPLVAGLREVTLAPGTEVEQALAAYRASPLVVYAQPNYRVHAQLTIPNDPGFPELWGLHNTNDADIDAADAWDFQKGNSSIVVAVIDTGVDYTHPDLAANMWTNPGETAGNGIDDDLNGIVDDYHGANFVGLGNPTGDPYDDNSHGTHVAGTIGAVGNNSLGVTGVSWNVQIMAIKFLDAGGSGSTIDAIEGLNYAVSMGAMISNNSWGGGPYDQGLYDAIFYAGTQGHLFVAAAGNNGSDADSSPMFPAAYDLDNIVSVAATDQSDALASFSNYGATSVDLAAPGVSVYSTMPGGAYDYLSGTSMASPHVAGAAALLWSHFPGSTPLQIKQRILDGADYIGDVGSNGFLPTLTNGRLNVMSSMEVGVDVTAPDAVIDLAAGGSGMATVNLNWTATGDDGSVGTASSYDVRYSSAPITEANWASATRATGEPQPQSAGSLENFTVTGLDHSTTYYFALKVRDNGGNESLLSNEATATTQAAIVLFEEDMESGAAGWGASGLWHLSGLRSNSPSTAFYYGDEFSGTYDTGFANSGTLTSPAIDLSGVSEAVLTFHEFRQVEDLSPYDAASLQVSSDGATWTSVWSSYYSTGGWVEQTVDLTPWVGGTVYLQFSFDTFDDWYNYFEGWYVDDVAILAPGSPQPAQPRLRIDNVSVVEGNSGVTSAEFTVTLLNPPADQTVTVNYATADGTGTVGSDYQVASDVLTFEPGQETSQKIFVTVNSDGLNEANETFFVNLSSPGLAARQAVGTILNDDPVPDLTISDVSAVEGHAGTQNYVFTVNLSAVSGQAVTVNYATGGGTATAGSDYQAVSSTLTIPAGQTSGTITVLVNGDRVGELNENFFLNLSGGTNVNIVDGQGVGTIENDEPHVTIGDISKAEGNKNQKTLFVFTVTLSGSYDQPVTMSFKTVNGTAKSGEDYTSKTGTLTFAPFETTKTITIEVKGDTKKEGGEVFYVDLFGNSGNSVLTKNRGIGTILNDD